MATPAQATIGQPALMQAGRMMALDRFTNTTRKVSSVTRNVNGCAEALNPKLKAQKKTQIPKLQDAAFFAGLIHDWSFP
ncbi:MAG: hypothetical protein ACO1QS_09565 [Verrucomicrobiota bacterium]